MRVPMLMHASANLGSNDRKWLVRKTPPVSKSSTLIRSVDLFAGCGGLTLGLNEACRRVNLGHKVELALDNDPFVLDIFRSNFRPRHDIIGDVDEYFDGGLANSQMTENESLMVESCPKIVGPDLLIGGPPCQGHSDLNNHSRRTDPRNSLYFRMIRAAQILKPKAIIIENVENVIHSKQKVVQNSTHELMKMGYMVEHSILKAEEFGVPQLRRRHFLIASRTSRPDFSILGPLKFENNRTLRWAIEDLVLKYDSNSTFDSSANSNEVNRSRMKWLIENDEFDLPNELRPECHKNGHNYPAVYGRMRWDVPAHTITAGFGSNGQGRFTHPDFPRTLTPHEAARVQTFPDWFNFGNGKRSTLSKSIGNAVPPLLGMYASFVALSTLEY